MTPGKLDGRGLAVLMQTASPEAGGIFTCEQCAKFYSHARDTERRYHNLAQLFLRVGGSRLGEINQKTQRTYAEDFESITGNSPTAHVEQAKKNKRNSR